MTTQPMSPQDARKQAAAIRALDYVQSGMRLGLGTGTTAGFVVEELAARLKDGRLTDIVGVPTSNRTRELAEQLGVPLTTFEETVSLDLTIDGADEVDPDLDLIKGHGGALLREKIVATASRQYLIAIDQSKRVQELVSLARLPVEVVRFGWKTHLAFLESLGAVPELRMADGRPFVTDEGHYILDCQFERIDDSWSLQDRLEKRTGIVEHGLFLGMADMVVVGTQTGVEVLTR